MSRLVVVSNRVWPARGEALAGGLAVAIASALHDRGGLWVGWSGKITDQPADQAQLVRIDKDRLTLATIDFSPDEHEGYYNGYANRCLWPLCHFRIDLTAYESRFAQAYRQVNRRMARALLSLIAEDDLIWVHDYH